MRNYVYMYNKGVDKIIFPARKVFTFDSKIGVFDPTDRK